MPSALIIQHGENGPAGLVADRLEHHGYELHPWFVSAADNGNRIVPVATDFELVVPLGSAHSVYDVEMVGSWIDGELDVLRAAHDNGVPVFGICFGAQALCAALGGVVERSPEYEAGWVEVDTDDDAVVPRGPWFTWHGDRCILPDGVNVLARNDGRRPGVPARHQRGRAVPSRGHPRHRAGLDRRARRGVVRAQGHRYRRDARRLRPPSRHRASSTSIACSTGSSTTRGADVPT